MKKTLIVACITTASLIALAGCQTQETKSESAAAASAPAAEHKSYEETVAMAKAEMKKAGSMGASWRDTGKLLKKADKAASAGDMEKATKLAEAALFQAKTAQSQAQTQAGVGNPAYLY